MSGIVGIYQRDGAPVAADLLERMTAALAHRGPDGAGQWIDGAIGFGQRMLHTTPESLHERQPLPDELGRLCLVLDGRVDNRAELARALTGKGMLLRSDTDAELVLRAYECWGDNCPGKIIGDFAFAIWDGPRRRLFCARDVLGIKPFYYHLDAGRFRFASELRQILIDPAVERRPNEGMLAEYLACRIIDKEETLFQGIYRLPPAHCLIVDANGVHKKRYWDLDPAGEIRHPSDQAYAEHFLDIFRESVRCRLRCHGPVGAELSGGLDSSSVVCLAQDLYRKGLAADRGFETFSMVFPGLACDESPYIQEVVAKWAIKSNQSSPDIVDVQFHVDQVRHDFAFPNYPNGTMHFGHYRQARDKGMRVLLTGDGCDQWLQGSLWHLADLVRGLRLGELCRQLWREEMPWQLRSSYPLLRAGLWPLVPAPVQNAVRRLLGRDRLPSWLDADFASRAQLRARIQRGRVPKHCRLHAADFLHRTLESGWSVQAFECIDRGLAMFGLEGRHPFNDRRVIEFAAAIPEEQRRRGAQSKFILRQAMHGLLPEKIRQRLDKGAFDNIVARQLRAPSYQQLIRRDMVDGRVAGARVQAISEQLGELLAARREDEFDHYFPLWLVLGLEIWYDTVWSGRETSASALTDAPTPAC